MSAVQVDLRPLRWWDLDRVLAMERDLFGATAWTPEMFWSELAHPEIRSYVVAERSDGTAVGYAGIMIVGSESDVQTVAVDARAQGDGLGGVLLRALLGIARERGATSVLLEVRADNAPAIALYTRHGFERIALRRGYYQPGGVDAHVMRLRPLPEQAPVERVVGSER